MGHESIRVSADVESFQAAIDIGVLSSDATAISPKCSLRGQHR